MSRLTPALAALCLAGWSPSKASTITSVSFAGDVISPTITVLGTGFNPMPQATFAAYPNSPYSGLDYGTELHFTDLSYNPTLFDAGYNDNQGYRDFIGLVILSYTNTAISIQFGSEYGAIFYPQNIDRLNVGDSFKMFVHDTSSTGTVTFIPEPTTVELMLISLGLARLCLYRAHKRTRPRASRMDHGGGSYKLAL